eukprot:CAMPEP_0168602160 /NCGR_PEP_ID=MMETSP0420-20121227/13883_1 /TAXON_ID=498008 /ORGANISM="Pessonella sp." /LENGTH=160 /DNA_ID=CAMNT_0008640727 /DNA_START=73 /DNA_END=555 /DNA_ORIENTATION=+
MSTFGMSLYSPISVIAEVDLAIATSFNSGSDVFFLRRKNTSKPMSANKQHNEATTMPTMAATDKPVDDGSSINEEKFDLPAAIAAAVVVVAVDVELGAVVDDVLVLTVDVPSVVIIAVTLVDDVDDDGDDDVDDTCVGNDNTNMFVVETFDDAVDGIVEF